MSKKSKTQKKMSSQETKPETVEKLDEDSASVEENVSEADVEVEAGAEAEAIEDTDSKKASTFNDEFDELVSLKEKENQIRNDRATFIKENQKLFEQKMKEFSVNLRNCKRENEVIFKKLKKLHNNEIKRASKEKRKRNGKNTGGFNSETLVPKKLRDFLDLEEGAMMSRPAVFHLMSEKYKEQGLKNGQEVVLDKKNAKKLGMPNGYKIPFSGQQPFIAKFYKEEKEMAVTV